MSPVRKNISLGRGGEEHDAADAAMAAHVGHRFTGKVAIVTGAASGIGRATAQRLAVEGAPVAALDIEDDLDETVRLVTAAVAEHGDGRPNGGRAAPTGATSPPRSRSTPPWPAWPPTSAPRRCCATWPALAGSSIPSTCRWSGGRRSSPSTSPARSSCAGPRCRT